MVVTRAQTYFNPYNYPVSRDGLLSMDSELVVRAKPSNIRKMILKWARQNNYKYLTYSEGYIKLKIGRYYSTPLIIFYICTFYLGAIIHYALRHDLGNLEIWIYPYQWGTLLILKGNGKKIPGAMKSLQMFLKAKKR